MEQKRDTYIIFDTETTGVNLRKHEVVQIAALRINARTGMPTESYVTLVRPENWDTIDPRALEINHLDLEDLRGAPPKGEVYPMFAAFLGLEDKVVGYNVKFDCNMVNKEFIAFGLPTIPTSRVFDIFPSVRRMKLPTMNNKLGVVCEHFGYAPEGAFHDALEDCKATNFLLRKLMSMRLKAHPNG